MNQFSILFTLIHFFALAFLLRVLFPGPSEIFFVPFYQWLRSLTDPVLRFFSRHRFFTPAVQPVIAIVILVVIEAVFIKSLTGGELSLEALSFRWYFLAALEKMLFFFYQSYLYMFLLMFSSMKYGYYYDPFFQGLRKIIYRSFEIFGIRQMDPSRHFGQMLLIFLTAMFVMFSLLPLRSSSGSIEYAALFLLGFRTVGIGIVLVLQVIFYLIILRAILSFFAPSRTYMLIILNALTDVVIMPVRKLNLVVGVFDLSPWVAMIGLQVLIEILTQLINRPFY